MSTWMKAMAGAVALWAASAGAAGLTAAQIVDRNVAARGGLEAWRAVKTISMSGEMDAGGTKAVRLPFEMSLKRPHKSRLELHIVDQVAVQTWDGARGWKYRPYLGRTEAEPLAAAEAQQAARADELDGVLVDHARKGIRVELQGSEKVEGREAYRLLLTQAGHPARRLWVDAATFLEVKMDGEPRRIDGRERKVSLYYRDYRKVGALSLPHTLETVVEGVKGPAAHRISVQKVTVNPALADELFGKPQPARAAAA